ncbi:MAG: DUF559 domain-containing protein [Candidatus Hydrogenedentes bacterium]|nr:DUF559 domain-containing protein [Candidatus Hydrogenedentota bacterium]
MNIWDSVAETAIGRSFLSATNLPIKVDDLTNVDRVLFPEPGLVGLADASDVAALKLAQVALIARWAYPVWLDLIDAFRLCESPIERLFLSAVLVVESHGWVSVFLHTDKSTLDLSFGLDMDLHIYPQCQIGDYRTDFLLEFVNTQHQFIDTEEFRHEERREQKSCLVVECDGHEFHEKTKQQASRDKKRDRNLQACGYRVFRFSGSDVYRDPFGCANECLEFLHKEAGLY